MPKRLANDYKPPQNTDRVMFRGTRDGRPIGFFTVEHSRVVAAPEGFRQLFAQRWADAVVLLRELGIETEEISRFRKSGWSAGRKG